MGNARTAPMSAIVPAYRKSLSCERDAPPNPVCGAPDGMAPSVPTIVGGPVEPPAPAAVPVRPVAPEPPGVVGEVAVVPLPPVPLVPPPAPAVPDPPVPVGEVGVVEDSKLLVYVVLQVTE